MIDISELETRLKKAQSRAEKAKAAYEAAHAEAVRLDTALSVVREMMGASVVANSSGGSLTVKQQILINSLKIGQNNAMSPAEVFNAASKDRAFDGDVNYVRTTLWRMADKGAVGSANGAYWKYPESVQDDEPEAIPHFEDRRDMDGQVSSFGSWDDDSEVPF
jgi:hypothetical protein